MVTKKNIYHYIVYVIFALIFFCAIGLYSISMVGSAEGSAIVLILIRYGIVFIVAALLVLVFKFVVPKIPEKFQVKEFPVISKAYEIVGIISVIVLMIFARVMVITSHFGDEIVSSYYDYAVGSTEYIPGTSYAAYTYASACRLLCKLSSTVYPIYAFNILLQAGIIAFAYFLLKRSFRMRYGVLVALLLSFMPYSINAVMNITPDTMLAFLYVAYLYYLSWTVYLNRKSHIIDGYQMLYIVALGVFSGFVAMFDILGISLLVLTVSVLLLTCRKYTETIFQNKFIQSGIYIVSFAGSLFLCLSLFYNNGLNKMDNVMNYIYSFIPRGLSLSFEAPMEGRIEGIALFVFAAIAIFAFIRNEFDKGLPAVIIIDFVSVFTFIKFNTCEYSYILNFFFIFITAVGFFELPNFALGVEDISNAENELMTAKYKNAADDEEEKYNNYKPAYQGKTEPQAAKAEEDEKDLKAVTIASGKIESKKTDDIKPEVKPVPQNAPAVVPEAPKPVIPVKESSESLSGTTIETAADNEEVTDNMRSTTSGLTLVETVPDRSNSGFIKNPLPGPKPHVARELTYDYDFKDDDLEFDITDMKGKDYYDI
ncbi:MAG: hypothetical protein J6X97_05090 [Lachnospiraceae bacterium]|nr:hypothetical protein [Lachnospiraceae bacterium]